ncbi:MAG: hypothetical protein CML06_15665 [Pseudomonadales bacterium]|nr:hypothetical protein [Pseudomonadales bacterium]
MGSLHCVGMCGGISTALATATAPGNHRWQGLGYQLLYSSGRLTAYACAGALAGLAGASLEQRLPGHGPSYLRLFAGIMMILLGFYISGWWKVLNRLERAGARLWKRIAPLTRHFIPVDHPGKALALGFLWGWLPCGLVYSALTWSLGAGGAGRGALLMVAFGCGTVPAMVSIGSFTHVLAGFARAAATRAAAALLLMGFGVWTLITQLQH